ncbi:non-muscle caldesmon-like [Thalassophryne amazonica]|uniref:non-muscle caldesmon-like n=1 Tax=Thalassophryne amazonica TaxID=390379 RepID=UPI0014723EBC|nr:non-muscle caldesmon-like [Thalassophryne amazonica]
MSESIKRRSSSRQMLQNLIRVTAQRSLEDAEEVERERRRRAREKQRGEGSPSWPEPPEDKDLTENNTTLLAEELESSCCSVLEEDEGFSDWSLKLEHRTEQEAQEDCRNRQHMCSASQRTTAPTEESNEEQEGGQTEQCSWSQPASTRPPEKVSTNNKEAETLHSPMVFLPSEVRLQQLDDQTLDGLFHFAAATINQCEELSKEGAEEQEVLQVKRGSEQRCQTYREEEERKKKEEQTFKEEEKGDFHLRREEKEELSLPEERSVKGVYERCEEPLACYGPMSPTFKKLLIQFYPEEVSSRVSADSKCMIAEKKESLEKSAIKKSLPPVAVSKIDKRLAQYTHALEDGDGLKVGVAELISQWVKGGEDENRNSSPSKPTEIKSVIFKTRKIVGKPWRHIVIWKRWKGTQLHNHT